MNYKTFIKRFKGFVLTRVYSGPKSEKIRAFVKTLRPVGTGKDLIRLGGERDGGYLLPDDLEGITARFSPGVGRTSNFELACANLGMKVFMADASVQTPAIDDKRFNFSKIFIGGKNGHNFITLENWINSSAVAENSDLLLLMDVEGHEYDILRKTSSS